MEFRCSAMNARFDSMYRAKPCRSSRLGKDTRDYVSPRGLDDLDHDLPDEVLFAREVVADHPLADTDPFGDASEGCLREADLGDRVDRRGDDLLAPSVLDERPLPGSGRHLGHEQNLRWLNIWTDFTTIGQKPVLIFQVVRDSGGLCDRSGVAVICARS